MRQPGRIATLFILAWLVLLSTVFILVTVPEALRSSTVLPELFWRLRDLIYPLFYSPSLF
jgi:hypothetical protein